MAITRAFVRSLLWALTWASMASADVAPPRHDPSCTLFAQRGYSGDCIDCCMGDGCPHPEIRCPAEERYLQRCIRYANPPYSAPTHAIWCDPKVKPSLISRIGIWAVPVGVLGLGAIVVGVGLVMLRGRRRSPTQPTSQ